MDTGEGPVAVVREAADALFMGAYAKALRAAFGEGGTEARGRG